MLVMKSPTAYVYLVDGITGTKGSFSINATYSFTATAVAQSDLPISMCADVDNNLFIAYGYLTGSTWSLRYRKLTWNSGTETYSVGSEVTVHTVPAGGELFSIDVDMPCTVTDYPVIAATRRPSASASMDCIVWQRNNAGSVWVTQTLRTVTGHWNNSKVSLATRQGAAASGEYQGVVTLCPGVSMSTPAVADPGDFVYTIRGNLSGTWVGNVLSHNAINKGSDGGRRRLDAFWLSNDAFALIGRIQANSWKSWTTIIEVSPSSATWTTKVAPEMQISVVAYVNSGLNGVKVAHGMVRDPNSQDNAGVILQYNANNSRDVYAVAFEWNLTGSQWNLYYRPTHFKVSAGFTPSLGIRELSSGERGKKQDSVISPSADFIVGNGDIVAYAFSRAVHALPVITTPPSAVILASATPDIITRVTGVGVDSEATGQRVQVQFSASGDYALDGILLPATTLEYFTTTPVSRIISTLNYPLTQGSWNVRARMISHYGDYGPWSTSVAFTVSHPGYAINRSPLNDTVLVFREEGTRFSWTFSDASPTDSQKSYEITVRDPGDGNSVVLATGEVISSDDFADLILDSGDVNKILSWEIDVKDQEGVAGDNPILEFFLANGPGIEITYPALDLDEVDSGTPTLTWDSGIPVGQTQVSWRVTVRSETGTILNTSGTVMDAGESYTVPNGVLRNLKKYSFDVTITDNLGITRTVSRLFVTNWAPPDPLPAPVVTLDFYDSLGFATVYVQNLSGFVDPNFLKYNLYRRILEGDAAWELIYSAGDEAAIFVHRDYHLPAGVTSEYVLTQVALESDTELESLITESDRARVFPENAHYWLIDNTDLSKSMKISLVTDDSFVDEVEEASYTVIGAGRQFEIGEELGILGSINAKVYDQATGHGDRENYNLVANPNFATNALGRFDSWTAWWWNTLEANTDFENVLGPPGPACRPNDVRTYLRGKRNGADFSVGVQQDIFDSPYGRFTAGKPFTFSVWIAKPPGAPPDTHTTARLEWRNGGSVVSTQDADFDFDAPSGYVATRVVGGTQWYRLRISTSVPVGTIDRLRISLYTYAESSVPNDTWVSTYFEGVLLTPTSDLVEFFDGYSLGCSWTGRENVDPSYTQGRLTARFLGAAYNELKKSQHKLVLRTPFGSAWPVHVSQMSISRVPGVGASEFTEVEIPYAQIREL